MEATKQLARFYEIRFYALAEDPATASWGPLADWCASTIAWKRGSTDSWTLRAPAARQAYSAELVRWSSVPRIMWDTWRRYDAPGSSGD
jgi:hypothetical protein